MKTLTQNDHFQPEIQGIRAVAVIFVIFYHSGLPGLPGGFIGVDVFFVISGYLITGLLLREIQNNGRISLARFYARRFRRLLPAATVVLAATIAVSWFVYSPLELKQFSSSAFASAVYLSNVWFAHLSTDYLAEDTNANPLLHTWSLGVEEQFYLVWPLLILMVHRYSRSKVAFKELFILFLSLVVISFCFSVWLTDYKQPWAFFGSPTRAWEFAFGGLAALLAARGWRISPLFSKALGWAGFFLILVGAIGFSRNTPFPGVAALLPVVGTTCLIISVQSRGAGGLGAFLSTGLMQWIGNISYALYLWHWPVFVFLGVNEIGLLGQLLSILLVFFLAWLTLILVENPVRFNRHLSTRVLQSLVLGLLLTVTSAAIAYGVRAVAASNLDTPLQKTFNAAKSDIPRVYKDDLCHLSHHAVELGDCVFGDIDSRNVVVLFGDSHAAHWFPALEKVAIKNKLKLHNMTKSGCPSMSYEPFNLQLGRAYTECSEWRENVFQWLHKIQPTMIVLSNSRKYLSDQVGGFEAWKSAALQTLDKLSPNSRQIVIIRDTPKAERSAPDCLSHAAWRGEDPEQFCLLMPQTTDEIYRAEQMAAVTHANSSVIDLTQRICMQSPCSVYSDGIVKFSDNNHLAKSYSITLAEELERKLFENNMSGVPFNVEKREN